MVTLSTQGVRFLLHLISTVVLARLLTPEDFGMVAMVFAVIGFIALFRDAGLGVATVQRETITHDQVSTLFWLNLGLSALLTLAAMAIAPLLVWLYGEPRLYPITLALAAMYLIRGLANSHGALMRRRMQFGKIAFISIVSLATSIAVAIIFALEGAGVWALVAMHLTLPLMDTTLMWLLSPWRPGRPKRGSGVRVMVKFGVELTLSRLLQHLSGNVDKILIGSFFGSAPLGFYSKAFALLRLPSNNITGPVNQVAIPVLSRLQSDPKRFRSYYRRGITLLLGITLPLITFAIITAEELVLLALGDQWTPAVPLFLALAPAALIQCMGPATGWLFVPLGRTNRELKLVAIRSVFTIAAILIGLRWGAIGVASAISILRLCSFLPTLLYAIARTPISLKDFLATSSLPLAATLSGALGALYLPPEDLSDQLLVQLATIALCYFLVYSIIWILFPGGLRIIKDFKRDMLASSSSKRCLRLQV